ncbi:hypothetical protein SynBOUM118_02316 [Synechococcus sp. BOUM118]|nr:hypothetical protein SynBOUM118_02316 [Synechococcus sp. BOUM118]
MGRHHPDDQNVDCCIPNLYEVLSSFSSSSVFLYKLVPDLILEYLIG